MKDELLDDELVKEKVTRLRFEDYMWKFLPFCIAFCSALYFWLNPPFGFDREWKRIMVSELFLGVVQTIILVLPFQVNAVIEDRKLGESMKEALKRLLAIPYAVVVLGVVILGYRIVLVGCIYLMGLLIDVFWGSFELEVIILSTVYVIVTQIIVILPLKETFRTSTWL